MPKLAPEFSPVQLDEQVRTAIDLFPQPKHGTRIAFALPAAYREMGLFVRGLYVSVKNGQAHWGLSVRTNPEQGEGRRMNTGLGRYAFQREAGALTYLEAAQKASDLYASVKQSGADPVAEAKRRRAEARAALAVAKGEAVKAAVTFKQAAIEKHRLVTATLTNEKSKAQWLSSLESHIFDAKLSDGRKFGNASVGTLTQSDVSHVLAPLYATIPETAKRVRMRLENVFDYAIAKDWFIGNNPAKQARELLPKRAKKTVKAHHAAMAYQDVPTFIKTLQARNEVSARALEFIILTAVRLNEAIGARWSEIDFDLKRWTIPADRMKARVEHIVALSDAAIAVLNGLQRYDGCDYVFVSARKKQPTPYSPGVFAALYRNMKLDGFTTHGFRSAFRDWAGEETHHPREVIEHALAHQLKDEAEAAYARGTLIAKRRALMEDWAAHCGYQRGADSVVTLAA